MLIPNGLKDIYHPKNRKAKKTIREKFFIPSKTRMLLFAGRLEEVKGISFLIQAFKEVLKTRRNVHLFIAGSGEFERWINEASACCSKITFTGRLDTSALYELYHMADIGILSSIHEEFGYVAIEMMMHEVPVIASESSGYVDIIEEGISGMRFPVIQHANQMALDVKKMSELICLYLDNKQYAKRIGKNGRKRFLEKYELNNFAKKMIEVYHSFVIK